VLTAAKLTKGAQVAKAGLGSGAVSWEPGIAGGIIMAGFGIW
jgi:hypothetical protein